MSKLTSMTKEQRDTFARLLAECDGDPTDESAFVLYAEEVLPFLLSDSERLAAIEAVTGEEVNSVIETIRRRGLLMEAIPVIFSLSARVAEQEEEIKRLRALSEGWHKDYSTQFRRAAAAEAERNTIRRLLTKTAVPALEKIDEFCDAAEHGTSGRIRERAISALSVIRTTLESTNA